MSNDKPRNPLALIRHYLESYEEMFNRALQANDEDNMTRFMAKIRLLRTLEADMEIEYFPLGDKTTLGQLRPGAVFATEDGVYAVKSEYYYPNGQCQCILLASGEYAHFPEKNATTVYEVIMPQGQEKTSQ